MTHPAPETDRVSNEVGLVPVQSRREKARRAWPKLLGLVIWLTLLVAYSPYLALKIKESAFGRAEES